MSGAPAALAAVVQGTHPLVPGSGGLQSFHSFVVQDCNKRPQFNWLLTRDSVRTQQTETPPRLSWKEVYWHTLKVCPASNQPASRC